MDEQKGFLRNSGERLATFMIYLNHVEAGGYTVFPELNVRIPPVKNAAAFWYNLKRSVLMLFASL